MTAVHRRSEQARQAILQAAFDICQQKGYAGLTIEGVASRAGVGKQTIYRWWSSKGTVVLDAFLDALGPTIDVPPAGDHLADLRRSLHSTADLLSHPRYGPMLADLVGALQHDEALAADFQQRVYEPIRRQTTERVERACAAGVIRHIDANLAADLLFGPLWFRALLMRQPPSTDYVDEVIDALLRGLAGSTPGAGGRE
ncbi:DNA-binding transcriptional regulator, AcrR family [Micromonospora viridifaciens]|uniref:DNA-binding transcriptional regulator, AcrR family n=1 Tax=Micromonospora viridifaciens TaxID=1881 RepID=A0A1C4WMZ7_MICVI|nr:TetR/AcrR family transcriptional regulator [Micromonospora viridifaciens]SCE97539.1 DNA-binding transcriptional regulator, AcrR family [Micromonospora viridifaciens]